MVTAALCAAVVVVAGASAGDQRQALLLPDLVQAPPDDLLVRGDHGSYRLGFASAVTNAGAGPLAIQGRRTSRSRSHMTAVQLIIREDGRTVRRPGVGVVRYARERGHSHWHLLRFDRYTLRRAGSTDTVVADHKSGFCLGDRFDARLASQLPGEPAQPPFTRSCGLGHPEFLKVTEGISVGYGDDYHAFLEGQELDISGLDAGRYELVHHANADERLLEERYDNNTACRSLDLSWPDGTDEAPRVDAGGPC
jgi:hypothetical protein